MCTTIAFGFDFVFNQVPGSLQPHDQDLFFRVHFLGTDTDTSIAYVALSLPLLIMLEAAPFGLQ